VLNIGKENESVDYGLHALRLKQQYAAWVCKFPFLFNILLHELGITKYFEEKKTNFANCQTSTSQCGRFTSGRVGKINIFDCSVILLTFLIRTAPIRNRTDQHYSKSTNSATEESREEHSLLTELSITNMT